MLYSCSFFLYMVEKFPNVEDTIKKYIKLVKKVSKKDFFFYLKITKGKITRYDVGHH